MTVTRKTEERIYCSRSCASKAKIRGLKWRHSQLEEAVVRALVEIGYSPISQYRIGRRTIDAFLPNLNVAIEVQGDYFHCNPEKYPNGPIDAIQRANHARDLARRNEIEAKGFRVVEIWQSDIERYGEIGALERVGIERVKKLFP